MNIMPVSVPGTTLCQPLLTGILVQSVFWKTSFRAQAINGAEAPGTADPAELELEPEPQTA